MFVFKYVYLCQVHNNCLTYTEYQQIPHKMAVLLISSATLWRAGYRYLVDLDVIWGERQGQREPGPALLTRNINMSEITRCAAVCLHCCSHISFPKVSLHLFNHFLFISFSGCMYEKYRNVSRCLVAYRRSTNHKATPESRRVFPYVTIIFGGCSSRDEKPLFPQLW